MSTEFSLKWQKARIALAMLAARTLILATCTTGCWDAIH